MSSCLDPIPLESRLLRLPRITLQGTTLWLGWGYFAAMVLLAAVFVLLPNDGWFSTVLLYAPRWPWVLPPVLLLPFALFKKRRKALIPVGLSFLLIVWPIWGLCVSWRTAISHEVAQQWRIMSLNCGAGACDVRRLMSLIEALQPDVIALQECGVKIDYSVLPGGGWHGHQEQGLLLLSRLPFQHVRTYRSDDSGWLRARAAVYRFDAAAGSFVFANIHLLTPRDGLEALVHRNQDAIRIIGENTIHRQKDATGLATVLENQKTHVLLAGDFNMPVESSLYRDTFGGYQNAFSQMGLGWGYTKFTRWHGIRIDHILADAGWEIHRCWVGPDVGSDHRPLIADLSLIDAPE